MFRIRQTGEAMEYLESRKLVHQNLCLKSLFFVETERQHINVRVGDYGLSNLINITHHSMLEYRARYLPPESLASGVFTIKSDVWAYGVTAWYFVIFSIKKNNQFF